MVIASLPPHPELVPDYEYVAPTYAAGGDYGVWKPSPNHSARPAIFVR